MLVSENKESLKQHLISFNNTVEYCHTHENDNRGIGVIADVYIEDQLAMEQAMCDYDNMLKDVAKYNERILKAIQSVKGKTFCKHLVEYIKDQEAVDYQELEIVKTPFGKEQSVSEYGREIKKEWITSYAVGDSGDSWAGTICVKLKKDKYLKFSFSM